MKHKDLCKRLGQAGFEFVRHGGDHDIYKRESDVEIIPRHKEINERLARAIVKNGVCKMPLILLHI